MGAKFALATRAASIVRSVRREVGTGPVFRKDIPPVLLLSVVRYLLTYRVVRVRLQRHVRDPRRAEYYFKRPSGS